MSDQAKQGLGWEHFSHGADVGVRGFGDSKETAFEQAALALAAVVAEPSTIAPSAAVEISCEAPDDDLLLVDWLNALIYEMAVRGMLFSRFRVQIHGQELRGKAWGERIDRQRHQPAVEVKGATYTALRVYRERDGLWFAECVVDV